MKDEFDAQPSHSAADGGHSIQTIQHTASSSAPPDAFNSPALLPLADSASSASTSTFTCMAVGPTSKSLFHAFVQPATSISCLHIMHHFIHIIAINQHVPGYWCSDIDDIALWVSTCFPPLDAPSSWPRGSSFPPSIPHQNGHLQHHPPLPQSGQYCESLEPPLTTIAACFTLIMKCFSLSVLVRVSPKWAGVPAAYIHPSRWGIKHTGDTIVCEIKIKARSHQEW